MKMTHFSFLRLLPGIALLGSANLVGCSSSSELIEGQNEEQSSIQVEAKPYPCAPGNRDYACDGISSFAELDKNGDHFISLKRELKASKFNLNGADKNQDKKISIIEFMSALDRAHQSKIKNRICVSNSSNRPIHWEILDTRVNARDEGLTANMGQHPPFFNGSGFICTEVTDLDGPYFFRAELNGTYCVIQNLTGDTMVTVQNQQSQIRCTPQRDGFHGTAAIAKEFPVEYASKMPKLGNLRGNSGVPFREIYLRNNSQSSSFKVTLRNPQGRNLIVHFSPLSGYRFDLNTRVDEFYQPIELQVQTTEPTAPISASSQMRGLFPVEKNLQCQLDRDPSWKYQTSCKGVWVGSYGFMSDFTIW